MCSKGAAMSGILHYQTTALEAPHREIGDGCAATIVLQSYGASRGRCRAYTRCSGCVNLLCVCRHQFRSFLSLSSKQTMLLLHLTLQLTAHRRFTPSIFRNGPSSTFQKNISRYALLHFTEWYESMET